VCELSSAFSFFPFARALPDGASAKSRSPDTCQQCFGAPGGRMLGAADVLADLKFRGESPLFKSVPKPPQQLVEFIELGLSATLGEISVEKDHIPEPTCLRRKSRS